jgi:hypothetical protein
MANDRLNFFNLIEIFQFRFIINKKQTKKANNKANCNSQPNNNNHYQSYCLSMNIIRRSLFNFSANKFNASKDYYKILGVKLSSDEK